MSSCDLFLKFTCHFALDLQNEIQLLSTFFCYSWLACFMCVVVENAPLDKKKSETMRKVLKSASRPASLSNYFAFDVFFIWFHVYAVMLRTFVRFETIYMTCG